MSAVDRFRALSKEERFKGWPLVGQVEHGPLIPFFGEAISYQFQTGNGVENYTSLLRHFGWAVVFGVVSLPDGPQVVTLCQWKPGVNQAGWELPPGGIGKIASSASSEEVLSRTQEAYLLETGFGGGNWSSLGHILIETGKYRGAGPEDHGLKAHMFLATDLEAQCEARNPNANEIMETLMVPLEEFRGVLESGLFVEESAVACAYKALVSLGVLHW